MKLDIAQIRTESPHFQQIEAVWLASQAQSVKEKDDALIDHPELILGFWQDILLHDNPRGGQRILETVASYIAEGLDTAVSS